MIYFNSSISLCDPVEHPPAMANSVSAVNFNSKSKQTNNIQKNRKTSKSSSSLQLPPCHESRSAVMDVLIFIAVVFACGFLLFPYIQILFMKSVQISRATVLLMKEEISTAPSIYISTGLIIFCAALATCGVVACATRKCGNPNCKGFRKAAEFDIQLETEEFVKNSASMAVVKKGLFESLHDHHRELEAELKKMAPPNGRAVLDVRARCGCSVGSLQVLGLKKLGKIKK